MSDKGSVLQKMEDLISYWEQIGDRRVVFLSCYAMMTENMQTAINAGVFEDNAWVNTLLEHFAGYYFIALEAYENQQPSPVVWKLAFVTAHRPRSNVLQDLVLGVNAHINYDLVFALSDLLRPEWADMTYEKRQSRYRDFCHVNDTIKETINRVQDQIVDRYAPIMGLVDIALGPLDEWITAWFISDWREEVWEHAQHLVEAADVSEFEETRLRVEKISMERAKTILGEEGLSGFLHLL
jgi:hypothetical protein